jgi:hypothetical protein
VDYKIIHLGAFDTDEEAARAYDKASWKYHGYYGTRNFQDSIPNGYMIG